jgi:predicted nucleic acid-binding protein
VASSPYILDTSAIFVLIENEDGADRVEQLLREKEILIPWLVLLEVTYISRQEWGEELATERYAMLKRLKTKILWEADESVLLTAARLKAGNRLSLADSIIASFAIQNKAIMLHKDPEYDALKGQVEMEALPYK